MKEITRRAKGLKKVKQLVDKINEGFTEYWNNFVEKQLVLIIGCYTNENYHIAGQDGPDKVDGSHGNNFYIKKVIKYQDEVEIEDLYVTDEDDFVKLGFVIRKQLYVTIFNIEGIEYWKFLSRFAKINVDYSEISIFKLSKLNPIRWVGAYNTFAGGFKEHSFFESINYETDPAEREKAAQAVVSIEELAAVCQHNEFVGGGLKHSKVGVLYGKNSFRQVFCTDVWSVNIGQYLLSQDFIAKRDSYENHIMNLYDGTIAALLMELEEFCDEDASKEYIEDAFNIHNMKASVYKCTQNKNTLSTIMKAIGYNSEEWITKFHFVGKETKRKMAKELMRKFEEVAPKMKNKKYYGMNDGNVKYHNEGFVKVGAKPTAIVVRGRIKDSNYEIIKRVAKEKGLEILHF